MPSRTTRASRTRPLSSASAKSSARTSITGTWIRKKVATRSTPLDQLRVLDGGDVVVQPDERRAADEFVLEEAQVGGVAERGEEEQHEQQQERGDEQRPGRAPGRPCGDGHSSSGLSVEGAGWRPARSRTRRLLLDGEALALGEGGDPGLPLVERGDGVGLVGEGLADGLLEVRLHPVEERRPLERGVDGAADPGEDLVDLLAAVEGGGVTDVRRGRRAAPSSPGRRTAWWRTAWRCPGRC